MFLLRNKLIMHGEKKGNIDQNLQRNNVARQIEGFCISYFAAFSISRIFSLYLIRLLREYLTHL